MNEPSKYWKLIRIDVAEAGRGFKQQPIPLAQTFFGQQFPEVRAYNTAEDRIYRELFDLLETTATHESTPAELCLRCYVSHPILQSCMKRARLFGAGNGFTYRDLLPFVLNDDGNLVQHDFIPFSIEILRSFSPKHNCSLVGWVDLRVKRNPELNHFLLERGLSFTSDWALLNRANPNQMDGLNRDLVEVFHGVYRRDRLHQQRQGNRQKCLDPTDTQLQEMMQSLQHRQYRVHSPQGLLKQLRQLAQTLRQEDIWGRRGFPVADSLEITDPETGETHLRDIPSSSTDPELDEQLELQQFCQEQLLNTLDQGIRRAICDRIHTLEKRPRYADLAHQFQPALRLLYFEGKSQGQIATILGMTNQCQVSRVLSPKELLMNIRQHTLEALLTVILEKARELAIVDSPVPADYLKNLMEHLEVFIDEKIFQAAAAEINSGRYRAIESLFAQRLRHVLSEQVVSPAA